MTTLTITLAIIHILNLFAIVMMVFYQRKESSARFAWILVLILLPVVGFILYMFFGLDYRRKERLKYSETATAEIKTYREQQMELSRKIEFAKPRFLQLARLNLVNNHWPVSSDNQVEIFNSGQDKFAALLKDLRAAERYIHLLYFIFRTDELGMEILKILKEKAAAGLDVKLVYDGIGNLAVPGQSFEPLKKAGGRVFRYSPMITSLVSANYRNHRKLAIIDGRVGYIGGMNIGCEYVRGRGALTPWRDTHLRLEGSAVGSMEAIFLPDYVYAANKRDVVDDLSRFLRPAEGSGGRTSVQLITSEPRLGRYHIHDAYTKMIGLARDYLYIQTPYLVPDKTVSDGLRIALASGVDLRIMIPLHPDKRLVWHASLDYARFLGGLGAKIYLYDGFIHSKVMLTDDQALSVGSANFDTRSFFLSYEANALIFDEKLAAEQRAQFHADIERCRLADDAFFASLPLSARAMMPVCRLFSPLL